MSRIVTPSSNQSASSANVPHEKIAMRAYEKWVKKGRPHGSHEQDWVDAERELQTESGRGATGSTASYSPPRR